MTSSAPSLDNKASPGARAVARWRVVVALALLLPIAALAVVAAWLHRQAFDDAHLHADRAARIAEGHTSALLGTHDMLLQRVLDMLAASTDEEVRGRDAEMLWQLRRLADALSTVQALVVLDAQGRLLASNRAPADSADADFSQDPVFRALSLPEAPPLHVSAPVAAAAAGTAGMGGDGAIWISRRRTHPDGGFAGLVQLSLRPQDLAASYREWAGAEPGLRITLMRSDGIVIADVPEQTNPAPHDAAAPPRASRRVGPYPLTVVAAIDPALVTAGWQQRMATLALAVVPFAFGLAGLAALALRRTRNEHARQQEFDQENKRLQRAELALQQSHKLEALGKLGNNVAHEVDHVLTVVERNLELLRSRQPEGASPQPLEEIEQALQSGTRLTRQLLSCGNEQVHRPERLLLQQRLPQIELALQALLAGSAIELECTVDENTAAVRADAAELELALINLAHNARDAMADGGRLSIRTRNAGPGLVQIEVQDSGEGIDPAVAKRAFDPFFSTRRNRHNGRGNGLGLTQVQAFCRAAGGHARIGPAFGGGTRVQMLLPGETVAALPHHASPAATHEGESALDTM